MIIEIDIWIIYYGIVFLFIYLLYNIKKPNTKLHLSDKYINNIAKEKTYDIECSCKTFFIDQSELKDCKYCIKNYQNYINNSKNKKKKCLSFPN
jgi:hypothetical protein